MTETVESGTVEKRGQPSEAPTAIKFIQTKPKGGCQGRRGGRKTESALNRYKVSAREEGKLLEMEHNSENYLMHRTVHLKVVKMVKLGYGYFIIILKTVMKRQIYQKSE